VSVSETDIAIKSITWDDCNAVHPLPAPPRPDMEWGSALEALGKAVRKEIWISQDNSTENITAACYEAIKERDPERGKQPLTGLMPYRRLLSRALAGDITIIQLPTLKGVSDVMACLDAWWPDHWERQDKSDIDLALASTHLNTEIQFVNYPNRADLLLGRLFWLERLRDEFPGCPVTVREIEQCRRRRRVLELGAEHASGLPDEARTVFVDHLDDWAQERLHVPVNGDSVQEAKFAKELMFVGLTPVERCRVAAALLQTVAEANSETCLHANNAMHPIHGYALVFGDSATGDRNTLIGASPGCWRLQIEGEQYVLTCDVWPRPVIMSHHEFGRARGSANAILRDVGVSLDSPPGHWKKIWETYGLRNQLLVAARRVDPRIRLEKVFGWIHQIVSTAPAAHRPPIDGSAVRLSDGATVVDVRWLVERALADGVIMPHERDGLEREIRRRSTETNRRDAAKRQRKLLVLDAGPVASETPLISKAFSPTSKNSADR